MDTLAARLERVLTRAGLSVRGAAELADVSFGYVARLMKGDREKPSQEVLTALARVCRTTPEYLRDGTMAVDLWAPFTRDPQFRPAGVTPPGRRCLTVLEYASLLYPGHLQHEDLGAYFGGSWAQVRRDLLAETVSDEFIASLAQLAQMPAEWLKLGHYAFIPQDVIGDWSELQAFLERYSAERK